MVRTNNSLDARPELVLGARGWEHEGWSGTFYPADLPPEWRLAYYANEFQAVLVPEECWRQGGAGQIAQWRADVGSGFRFFLEIGLEAAATGSWRERCADLQAKLDALAGRIGGLVIRAARPASGREMEELLNRLPVQHSISLVLPDEAAGLPVPPQATPCWLPGQGARGCATGLVSLEDERYALRGLRREIEAFRGQAQGLERAFLFVQGDPPGFQGMRDAGVIAGLLG